jgi:hypothetical protein
MQQIGIFIAKLIFRSTCFGHYYARHQKLKSWRFGVQVVGLVWSCGLCVRFANSKFCNKETNLLHLVDLLMSTYSSSSIGAAALVDFGLLN